MSFYRKSYRPRRGGEEPEKCADPAKARARALDALSAREMTSTQLYERLCSRFTEQAAAAAVAEMVELDYVNDDRYAETRAHGLLMARKSRRAAAQNLRQKGLNSQQIEQALETVYAPDENGESPELEAAAALVMQIQTGIMAQKQAEKVGQTVRVLCDGIDEESGLYLCRTTGDAPEVDGNVCVSSEEPLYPGQFYDVLVDDSDLYDLYGTVVK